MTAPPEHAAALSADASELPLPRANAGFDDPQDDPAVRAGQEQRLARAWRAPPGWRYWTEVNNIAVAVIALYPLAA